METRKEMLPSCPGVAYGRAIRVCPALVLLTTSTRRGDAGSRAMLRDSTHVACRAVPKSVALNRCEATGQAGSVGLFVVS